MSPEEIRSRIPSKEIVFATSRSGGPGGQNVNKVNTKVELRFNIWNTNSFTDSEKESIEHLLKNRINSEGDLLIISQSARSQLQNRKAAEEMLFRLLAKALTPKPVRRKTKPTESSKERRLNKKIRRGRIKTIRRASGKVSDE